MITDFWNEKIKMMEWYDIALVKFAVLFFTLMLAKLWPAVLAWSWQTYLVLWILASAYPAYKFYLK